MVQLPDRAELRRLQDFKQPFCLTIYAPYIETDPSGATNPNKIELKNLLRQAETTLLSQSVDMGEVKKMLRPAKALLANHEFWSLRNESLALFIHAGFFRYFLLPNTVPHMLTIEQGFNLEPLVKVLKKNRPYLVLALSHKHVQLFEGDRFGLKELKVKNLPTNLEQALRIDEHPKVAETHGIAPAGAGGGTEAYHSQYNARQADKELLLMFFRLIDRSLRPLLRKKDMPLVLAGVEYLLPLYHQANTSPHLLREGIRGNVEHEQPDTLRRSAWRIVAKAEAV